MATAAAMPSRITFNMDEVQKWIGEVSENPTIDKFEEVKQKVIQEVQRLGLTNGELRWMYFNLDSCDSELKEKRFDHFRSFCGNLSATITTIFAEAIKKEQIVSKLPPIDFDTLNELRKQIEDLKTNGMMIDEVRATTLKALKTQSYVTEKEIKDIERRFLLIKDKLIANGHIDMQCNCLFGRLRTIFLNRGTKLPREPSKEAQELILKLIQCIWSSNSNGVQQLIKENSIEDLDFHFNQLPFDRMAGCPLYPSILAFALHQGNESIIALLLLNFKFDITEETLKLANRSFADYKLLSYFIPVTFWENEISQRWLKQIFHSITPKWMIPDDKFMSALVAANIHPQSFVRADFEPVWNFNEDNPIWKQALYYGAEFRYYSEHEKAMVIQSTITKNYLFSRCYRVQDNFVEHRFMPHIITALNAQWMNIQGITEIVLQFLPKTYLDMPPRDCQRLHHYCITVAKVYKSDHIPSPAEIKTVLANCGAEGSKAIAITNPWYSNCIIS